MNDYERRMEKERTLREVRLIIYVAMINKLFDKKDFEEMLPIEKIEIMTIINKHQRLLNRFES